MSSLQPLEFSLSCFWHSDHSLGIKSSFPLGWYSTLNSSSLCTSDLWSHSFSAQNISFYHLFCKEKNFVLKMERFLRPVLSDLLPFVL